MTHPAPAADEPPDRGRRRRREPPAGPDGLPGLTPEEIALVDAWPVVGPADRHAAERGVAEAYAAVGLPPPQSVLWTDSPHAAALAAADLCRRDTPAGDRLLVAPWHDAAVSAPAADRVRVSVRVRERVWDLRKAEMSVVAEVRRRVGERIARHIVGDEWTPGTRARRGHRWLDEVVAADVLRQLGAPGHRALTGQLAVARHAGWWWPFRNAVVLAERPLVVNRDDRDRPHHPTGPAIRYPDGFSAHVWHGVRVSEALVTGELTGRSWIDAGRDAAIDAYERPTCAAVRLAIVERIGHQRIIDDLSDEVAAHERAGDRFPAATARCDVGEALADAGRFEAAADAYRRAAAVFAGLAHGDNGAAGALNRMGEALRELGRHDEAIEAHLESAAGYGRLDDRHGQGSALMNLGLALRAAGRADEAREWWELALWEFNNTDAPIEYEEVRALLEDDGRAPP